MMPKMNAPIGRVASASVIVSAMSGRVFPNALATSSMMKVSRKKSNASNVQPRNPARTAFRWLARSCLVIVAAGFAAFVVAISWILEACR
jgi:hypothetical protein